MRQRAAIYMTQILSSRMQGVNTAGSQGAGEKERAPVVIVSGLSIIPFLFLLVEPATPR
jgi:hypothetical protein